VSWETTITEEFKAEQCNMEQLKVFWLRHKEKLHNIHASTNIITVIKSRKMRWARHVACMGDIKNARAWC